MSAAELFTDAPLPYLLAGRRGGGKDRPVLLFLHGYGEAAPLAIERALMLHGPLYPANVERASRRFIVVAPQLPVAGDLWHRFDRAVLEVLEAVRQRHGGDPRRTYLTGFSFGGNGVFDLALSHPAEWAALWAVDPTRVPPCPLPCPVWLSFGEVSRHRRDAYVRTLGLRLARGDLQGDAYYGDDKADHAGAARLAYGDERIYDWLLSKRL